MARRRRKSKARRNPRARRNSKGRFTRLKANPKRRRRARRNPSPAAIAMAAPRTNPRRRKRRVRKVAARKHRRVAKRKASPIRRRKRRVSRKVRKNSSHKRRHRRIRRNPSKSIVRRKRKYKRRSVGLVRVGKYRKAIKKAGKRRSLKRSVARATYHRASALRRYTKKYGPKRAAKSALSKAMTIRTNPGLSGLIASAKVLIPQAGAGAVSMIGCAMIGQKIGKMITSTEAGPRPFFADKPGLATYMPSIATAATAVGGYMLADKFAPKYKGAVAIGGLLAAVIQAIVAASSKDPNVAATAAAANDSFALKAKRALLGDYTTVGYMGDYTTVGGRAYAEGGMFREIGDYTTVGEGADNATEFAHDSLRGLDDTTEWAAGEGGILSGGMFRGPSSR